MLYIIKFVKNKVVSYHWIWYNFMLSSGKREHSANFIDIHISVFNSEVNEQFPLYLINCTFTESDIPIWILNVISMSPTQLYVTLLHNIPLPPAPISKWCHQHFVALATLLSLSTLLVLKPKHFWIAETYRCPGSCRCQVNSNYGIGYCRIK